MFISTIETNRFKRKAGAMKLKYILTEEKDRAFFIHVHHTAYRDTIEEMFGWDEKRQDELANRPFDEGGIHIIWNGDVRIGVIGWEERDDHLWLKELFLLPEYQRQGIGSQIIKDTITKARLLAKDVRLRTLKANVRAKELYERHGFEVTEATDIHWNMIRKFDYAADNTFAKIIRGELPCNKVYEDDFCLAFYDIAELAPVHVLIIPKEPYVDLSDFLKNATNDYIAGFWRGVSKTVNNLEIEKSGYNLFTSIGSDYGQEVFHFHVHVTSGKTLHQVVSI